jgi:hypothetical protein
MKTIVVSVIGLVVVVVVGIGAFFAGSAYGQQQAQNIRNDFLRARQGGGGGAAGGANGAPGQFGQGGQGAQAGQGGQASQFGRPVAFGTVKSISGNTMIVTQQDGTTVTVTVDSQTSIQKTAVAAVGDIQTGERVTVTSDQTGSNVLARSIQLRPNTQ